MVTCCKQAPVSSVWEIVKRVLTQAFLLPTEMLKIIIYLCLLYKPTFLKITYEIHTNHKILVMSLVMFISFFLMSTYGNI